MENIELEARNFIENILLKYDSHLDEETKEEVNHYLEHDEYEMAFEGLFIDLIKINDKQFIDSNKSLDIAKKLGLDKESVFDPDFWVKLQQW